MTRSAGSAIRRGSNRVAARDAQSLRRAVWAPGQGGADGFSRSCFAVRGGSVRHQLAAKLLAWVPSFANLGTGNQLSASFLAPNRD